MIASQSAKQLIIQLIGEDRYYTFWAKRKLRRVQRRGLQFLFIHQMGKVGSTAVVRSLHASGYDQRASILQTHFLSPQGRAFVEQLESDGQGGWPNVAPRTKRFLMLSRAIGNMLEDGYLREHKSNVITLVRDPVATNVSGFFHNHLWWPTRLQDPSLPLSAEYLQELCQQFLMAYPHEVPLTWFGMELEPLFGIDVFATPFPKERGFNIYRGQLANVLLLKLNRLHDTASEAFGEFLGIENFELVRANEGGDKWYADVYQSFKKKIDLPASYADRLYQSPFAQHFYTDAELDDFRSKWCHL